MTLLFSQKYSPIKIAKVGIEVEGIWNREAVNCFLQNANQYNAVQWQKYIDGSINGEYDEDGLSALELVSSPVEMKDIESLYQSVEKDIYPLLMHVNNSCGFHIHVSLKRQKYYSQLATFEFIRLFQEAYRNSWNLSAEKRRMDNAFCSFYRDLYDFDKNVPVQMSMSSKKTARYRSVNYPLRMHHTIEFRIFPGVTRRIIKYTQWTLNLINTFLDNPPIEDEHIAESYSIDSNDVFEEEVK